MIDFGAVKEVPVIDEYRCSISVRTKMFRCSTDVPVIEFGADKDVPVIDEVPVSRSPGD